MACIHSLLLVTAVAVFLSIPGKAAVPVGTCITTCNNLPNGDYQSCHGCEVYATCSNGLLYDMRPCPANLVWDDILKRCEWESDTCGGCGNCVTSCGDRADGVYQSCQGCSSFVTCKGGALYDRACPQGLLWDDDGKRCAAHSSTCPHVGCGEPPEPGPCSCITSCEGRPDGDYQSCHSCHVYATCSNGDIYDRRDCPAGLVWDDNMKRCEWTSTTCGEGCQPETPECDCVDECDGVQDGDYQSCQGCHVYVSCVDMMTYDNRHCPAGLLWDDNKKYCDYTSSTCTDECEGPVAPENPCDKCVRSCNSLADGDYQSCQGCHVYASCSNGVLSDNRPCPPCLVWDDSVKTCVYVSTTCGPACEPDPAPCYCIKSCNGLQDGDYQSCMGCDVYATCSKGVLEDGRACGEGLVWDDHAKRCEATSHTCREGCTDGGEGSGSSGEGSGSSEEGSGSSEESSGSSESESSSSSESSDSTDESGSSSSKSKSKSKSKESGSSSSKSKSKSKSKESGGSSSKSKSKESGSVSKSKSKSKESGGGSSKSKESGGGSSKSKSKESGGSSSKSKSKSKSKESGGSSSKSKGSGSKSKGKGKGKGKGRR